MPLTRPLVVCGLQLPLPATGRHPTWSQASGINFSRRPRRPSKGPKGRKRPKKHRRSRRRSAAPPREEKAGKRDTLSFLSLFFGGLLPSPGPGQQPQQSAQSQRSPRRSQSLNSESEAKRGHSHGQVTKRSRCDAAARAFAAEGRDFYKLGQWQRLPSHFFLTGQHPNAVLRASRRRDSVILVSVSHAPFLRTSPLREATALGRH